MMVSTEYASGPSMSPSWSHVVGVPVRRAHDLLRVVVRVGIDGILISAYRLGHRRPPTAEVAAADGEELVPDHVRVDILDVDDDRLHEPSGAHRFHGLDVRTRWPQV